MSKILTKITADKDKIVLVWTENRNSVMHYKEGGIFTTSYFIKKVHAALGEGFFRIHRGIIINTAEVRGLSDDGKSIIMSNNQVITPTRKKRKSLFTQLNLI